MKVFSAIFIIIVLKNEILSTIGSSSDDQTDVNSDSDSIPNLSGILEEEEKANFKLDGSKKSDIITEAEDTKLLPNITPEEILKYVCQDPCETKRGKDYELRCKLDVPIPKEIPCPTLINTLLAANCLQASDSLGGVSLQCLNAVLFENQPVFALCCLKGTSGCSKEKVAECKPLQKV